jgi:hypothetical protein
VELTGRAIEGAPHRLLIEIALALFKKARARIQVALPEHAADRPVQERWTECPDPPCHEVIHFEFALRPDVQPQVLPIRVLAEADGVTRELHLMAPIDFRMPG